MTLTALMAAICLVLLVLGLSPQLSRRLQRGVDRALGAWASTGARAPGRL